MVAVAKTKPRAGLAQPLKKYPLRVEAKDLKNLIINMKFVPAPEDDFHAHPEHYIFVAHHHKDYGFDIPYPASRNEQKRATGRRGKSMHIFASNIFKRSTIERVIPLTSPSARLAIKVSKGKSSSKKYPSSITPYNSHGYYKDGNNIQNWLQQNSDTPEYSLPSSRRSIKLSSSKNRAAKVRTSPPKGKGSSKSNALRKNPRITHKLRKASPLAIGKTKRTKALKGKNSLSKIKSPQRKAKTRYKMTKDKTTKTNNSSSGTSTGTSSESSSKKVSKVTKDNRHLNSASDTSSGTSEKTSASSNKHLATSEPQKRSPAINFKIKNPLVSDSTQTGRGLGRAKISVLNTIFHKPKGTLLKSKLPQGKTFNKMSQLPGGKTATSRLRRRRGAISLEKELKVPKRVNNRKEERSLMTRAKPVCGNKKKVVSSKRPKNSNSLKPKVKFRLSENKNNSSHPGRYNKRALKSSPKQDVTKVFQASTAVKNSKRLRKPRPGYALQSKPDMVKNRKIMGKNASHLKVSNKKLNFKKEHGPLNSELNLKMSQSTPKTKKLRNVRHKLTAEVKSLSPKKVKKLSHARSSEKVEKRPKRLRSQSPSKSKKVKSKKAFNGSNKSPTSKVIRKSRSSSPGKNYGNKRSPITASNQQLGRLTQKRARSMSAKDSPFVKHIIKAAKKPFIKSRINYAKSLPTSKKRTNAIKPIRQHQRLHPTKYKDKNIASSSNRKNDKDKKILSSSNWLNALPWPLSPNDTTEGDDTTGNGFAEGKINADRYDSDSGESNFSSRLLRLLGFPEIKRRRSLKTRLENPLSNAKKKANNQIIIKESSKRARLVQTGKPISKNVNASRSLVSKKSKANLKRKAEILENKETSLNYSKKLHKNGDSISELTNDFPDKENPGKISQTISSWIFHPFSSVTEPRENSLNLPSSKNAYYVDGSMHHSHSPNLSHKSVDIPIELNFDAAALLNVQESENNLAQGSNHGLLNAHSSSQHYNYSDLYTNNITTTTTKTITTTKIFTHDDS